MENKITSFKELLEKSEYMFFLQDYLDRCKKTSAKKDDKYFEHFYCVFGFLWGLSVAGYISREERDLLIEKLSHDDYD